MRWLVCTERVWGAGEGGWGGFAGFDWEAGGHVQLVDWVTSDSTHIQEVAATHDLVVGVRGFTPMSLLCKFSGGHKLFMGRASARDDLQLMEHWGIGLAVDTRNDWPMKRKSCGFFL